MAKINKGKMFGELEEMIMETLWAMGSGTVRDVLDRVSRRKELAYTTVMTVMCRLVDKNILCRKQLGDGSFLYSPKLSQRDLYARTSRTVLNEIVRKFGSIAVAQFIDILEETDPKEIKKLRDALERKK